eukprot:11218694-Lingulodinium_polyedra.AAC.1
MATYLPMLWYNLQLEIAVSHVFAAVFTCLGFPTQNQPGVRDINALQSKDLWAGMTDKMDGL